MSNYEQHCRTLGKLSEVLVDVVKEAIPLQTFKPKIAPKSYKLLTEIEDELTCLGNDGLNMIERAKRPPSAILLGTSSAGKTEVLNSFLPKLRSYSGSTAADTTPMLVRLRYPHEFNPEDHGKVNFLLPHDFFKLLSDLPRVREVVRKDDQLADTWNRVNKIARESEKRRDEEYERKLYKAIKEWAREASNWSRVSGSKEDAEYFPTLFEVAEHFDPDSQVFRPFNPVPRGILKHFLDKGKHTKQLAAILRDSERLQHDESMQVGKTYYLMRTVGAITEVFVEEDILKDIDIYDSAGVRVGGDEADIVSQSQMVHSQIQAFKNEWGFQRLIPSVDIVIFILVIEEQQVDTLFQKLFEECRKYGNLKRRLFILLNKADKAIDQAITKKDYTEKDGEIMPDDGSTWKLWLQTNVMDKIRGLGEDFRNVFVCRAPKFDFKTGKKAESFVKNSKNSNILNRYLYDVDKNLRGLVDNTDGGIKFAWKTVEKVMREEGSEIRYIRLGQQILPYAKDLLTILGAKRLIDEQPTDKEIDTYMEKILDDLKDLRWRTNEFRLPEKFGEFCIQKKFCTSKQVEEALNAQKEAEEKTGRRPRIGQILVDKKYMTLEQVRVVLSAAEEDQEDWELYQKQTFKHVRERVTEQIIDFMEEKGRPIIKGNIPVESVMAYLTEPINILEQELKGLYTNTERKAFQEGVQNVMECQVTAALWNQERLRKFLWDQKQRITSTFHIRDDISEEEAKIVTVCYDKIRDIFDELPPLES